MSNSKKGRGGIFTTHDTIAFNQTIKKETKTARLFNEEKLKTHSDNLNKNINYLTMYKNPEVKKCSVLDDDTLDDQEKFYKSLPFIKQKVYKYDPKEKDDKQWTVNKAQNLPPPKELFTAPMTSNQGYGWRQPYDFHTNFGLKTHFVPMPQQFRKGEEKPTKPE